MKKAIGLLPLLLACAVPAAEPVRVNTGNGVLYGTIEMPVAQPPLPVVLLIAGSGPTDRDGNSILIQGQNNSLKMLAEALASRGIASLRYDKRGAGESVMPGLRNEDVRFETFVDDAVRWAEYLRKDKHFRDLVVVGHSEGSLIAMIAARKASAEGYASIAGMGQPGGAVILRQIRGQGTPPDLMKPVEDIVKSIEEGREVESVPEGLAFLFGHGMQPYLISWFRYDPAKEIARLKVPVLILQGTTDVQVTVNDAKLLAAANPGAKLVILDGINHVLKEVPADRKKQLASYGDPSLPVAERLVEEIAGLVARSRGK